jgi:transcription elongation factor Elf1
MPRTKPYTEIGIRRLKCIRCGKQASFQWTICADGNYYRPICVECDIALNELVLRWAGFPDWEEKIAAYRETKMVLLAKEMSGDES